MRKTITAVLATLALSTAVAQTINVGLFQDPPNLDPALSTATSEYVVLAQIYDTLLTFDENGAVAPNLATSWTVSEDGLTYSFELRDDVTFHDGTPFDAEAMKFSLERTRDMPAGAFIEQLGAIDTIEATGPYSLVITLTEPQGAFINFMADRSASAISPNAAETAATTPVGTGPFRFVSRVQQDNITLEANEDYWGDPANVDGVVFRFFTDGSVRFANLRSDAVDIIYPIEARDYVTAQDDESITLYRQQTNGWRILVFNTTRPPFDNVELRRAIADAIDQTAINQVVFNGLEEPATGLIASNSPYFTPNDFSVTADPEAAAAHLAESGLSNVQAAVTAPARSPEVQITQLLQAMTGQIGVNLSIEMVESGEYQRRYTAKDFDAQLMQWSGQADPSQNVTSFLITDGFWNWSGYSNPEVDAWLDEAASSSDVARRQELYGLVLEAVNRDVPHVPLTNQVRLVATGSDISGVQLQAGTGILILKDVAKDE